MRAFKTCVYSYAIPTGNLKIYYYNLNSDIIIDYITEDSIITVAHCTYTRQSINKTLNSERYYFRGKIIDFTMILVTHYLFE